MTKKKILQNFQPPKGMHDIMPQDQLWWDKVRKETDEIAETYGFKRIETTLLERAEVFEKSLGQTSDIVEKQMFTLKIGGGERFVLRPEGTAAVARAYFQHGLSHLGFPLKLFYMGPMFRKEQPQAGRLRQFNQVGFEIISGDADPIYDAQIILATVRLLESLKIKDLSLHINSIGCKICRPNYKKKLLDYYKGQILKICKDCKRRMKSNPLRLLDCKNEICQQYRANAPIILDTICEHCKKHLKSVLEYLEELSIPYQLDNYLVRGLDYYNKTVFEIFSEVEGKDGQKFNFALGGGGRYDYLFEMFGSRQTAGVGSAMGIERVLEAMKLAGVNLGARTKQKVFFIHIGDVAKKKSLALIEELRKNGIFIIEALGKNSLRAQLDAANKENVNYTLIFGQKEAFEESIIIRDFRSGVQETVPLKKMVNELKKRLK